MIALLGASGYIGQAFTVELERRGKRFIALARGEVDYTNFDALLTFLRRTQATFLINAAGYTGNPNVDACELARADTLLGNVALPQTIAQACRIAAIPWGHVSSGCIYSGAKVLSESNGRVVKNMMIDSVRAMVEARSPSIRGFTEEDEPNFTFRNPPCSFYSGSKALAEEIVGRFSNCYIWRLRIPFDQYDHPRNYISKLLRYSKAYDNVNSISHRGDFVRSCVDLWEIEAPYGIYNITNPGYISTREVVDLIRTKLNPARDFDFWESDEHFYREAAKTARSNCIMDSSKLLSSGVQIRPVRKALEDALNNWATVVR